MFPMTFVVQIDENCCNFTFLLSTVSVTGNDHQDSAVVPAPISNANHQQSRFDMTTQAR
ncbi:MAG: hypothetical protein ACYTXA_21470 [Nostoc sp.]